MKTTTRNLFLSAAIALFFTLTLATLAQAKTSTPATAPAPEQGKSAPAVAPAEPAPAVAPAPDAATSAATETTPAETPKPTTTESHEPSKLRRLDIPSTPADEKPARRSRHPRVHNDNGNEVIEIGSNAFLAKGMKADAVVSVFGSATSEGDVEGSVVSVFGNSRATGQVGEAVVSVLGNTYVNGKVGEVVVAVFGTVELGPDAEVNDVVSVGGSIKRDPKAIVHGDVHNVSFGDMFSDMEWLHSWFVNCFRYGRLLAFAPHLMWAWWIALGFLALYVVLALLFGKGVDKCVETLEERPGFSILSALLTVLLAPVVCILLVLTGVGIAVVPFLAAGLFFAGIFGKVVMLAWLGRRLTRLGGYNNTALAVLVGGVIVLLLYTVPILSIVIYKLFGWVGLGVVVYTLVLNMKRERPVVPPVIPPAPMTPTIDPVTGAVVMTPATPPIVIATTLPRAGFWIRTAAVLLDVILVGIILAVLRSQGKMEVLALAAYGALMWKFRGSTIGGIICGLKVVRLDDRPLDWSTALVRTLGCFLSLAVLGLGFIWVAFDDQKQAWHDKIAGTTVVRVPRGVSLV